MATKKIWFCQTSTHTEAWLVEVPEDFSGGINEMIENGIDCEPSTIQYDQDTQLEVLDDLPSYNKDNYDAYEI